MFGSFGIDQNGYVIWLCCTTLLQSVLCSGTYGYLYARTQEVRYAELLEYKAEKGNCKVPQHYKPNKALGKWVAKQREQYKRLHKGQHSFLTPYRVEKLTAVGFVWQIRTSLEGELNAVTAETAAAAPPPVVKSPLANKSEPETPPVDADIPKAVIEEGVENEETTKGKETIRSEEVTTSDEMIKDEEMVKVEEMINDEDEGITKDKKIGVEV